jgi:hypothetical protein
MFSIPKPVTDVVGCSNAGGKSLAGVWPLEVAQSDGFVVSENESRTEATVYHRSEWVGNFRICERRESKQNPNRLLRWINEVPVPNSGPLQKRVQIDLESINLSQ